MLSAFLNIKSAHAEIARLKGELHAAIAERDTESAARASAVAEVERLNVQHDARVAELSAELSNREAQILAAKEEARTASERASQIVAAQGLNPDAIPAEALPADADKARAKVLLDYASADAEAKRRIYLANREHFQF